MCNVCCVSSCLLCPLWPSQTGLSLLKTTSTSSALPQRHCHLCSQPFLFLLLFFFYFKITQLSLFCMVSFNCTGNLTQRSNVVNGKYEHSIQYYTTSEVVLVMTGMLCRNVVSIITTFTLQLTSATNKGVTLQRFTALSLWNLTPAEVCHNKAPTMTEDYVRTNRTVCPINKKTTTFSAKAHNTKHSHFNHTCSCV